MQICVRAHDLEVKGTEEVINNLHKMGADGAQLVCYKSYEEIKKIPDGISKKLAKDIGNEFRREHLTLTLIGAYFNPVHSDIKQVETGYEIFCDYLRMTNHLGCRVVGSETGSYNDEPWIYHPKNRTDEALEKVSDIFRNLCDYAKEYNAIVGIEGASGHICYDVKTLYKATRLINRENIKIIFDLFNFMDESNYEDYLSILDEGLDTFSKRIHCFHIKDCLFTATGPKQCAVGKGQLDFDSILSIIKSYDENAVLILEGTEKEFIKDSIKFIKNKLEKANA